MRNSTAPGTLVQLPSLPTLSHTRKDESVPLRIKGSSAVYTVLTAGADCIRGLADALEFLIGSPHPDGGGPQTPPARQHSSPGPEPGLPNGSDGGNQVTFVIAGGVLACGIAEGRG